jgi:hypothetical protein
MSDGAWRATVRRVRGEFDEMPGLRVTPDEARLLFGLTNSTSEWVLSRLAEEGFLALTPGGQYLRRNTRP